MTLSLMDVLEDYWEGHPYIEFVTVLSNVPANFAVSCQHWGLQYHQTTPFIIDDSGTNGVFDNRFFHDMFNMHGGIICDELGNVHAGWEYPLRAILIPTVIDNEVRLKIHKIGSGTLGCDVGCDAQDYWSWYYTQEGEDCDDWLAINGGIISTMLQTLVDECLANPYLTALGICDDTTIIGCVDDDNPNVINYAGWATADCNGTSEGEVGFAESDGWNSCCEYEVPGCIFEPAFNCISERCCGSAVLYDDYELYPDCFGLDPVQYATIDDDTCEYSSGQYNQCINPYAANLNSEWMPTEFEMSLVSGCPDGTMDCCIFDCVPLHPFEVISGGVVTRSGETPGRSEVFRGGTSSKFNLNYSFKTDESDFSYLRKPLPPKLREQSIKQRIRLLNSGSGSRSRISTDDCTESTPCFIPIVFHNVYSVHQNSYQGITKSLCDESQSHCECLAYRSIQILNQQFKEVGIQFYRACTNDNIGGGTTVINHEDVGLMYGYETVDILTVEECNVSNVIDVLHENTPFINAGDIAYDHISLNWGDYECENQLYETSECEGCGGVCSPVTIDTAAHVYFSELFSARNINNTLNIYITSCIAANKQRCGEPAPYGFAVHPEDNNWAGSNHTTPESHYGIAIRQDAFYSKGNDGNPYNYATLPQLIGQFFGLYNVYKPTKECEGEECYENVNNDSEFLCSEGPNHQPCEGFDTDCGEEGTCLRRCDISGDMICDTPAAPLEKFRNDDLLTTYYEYTNIDPNMCLFTGTGGSINDNDVIIKSLSSVGSDGEWTHYNTDTQGDVFGTRGLDDYLTDTLTYEINLLEYLTIPVCLDGTECVDGDAENCSDDTEECISLEKYSNAPIKNFMANDGVHPSVSMCRNLGCDECRYFIENDNQWVCQDPEIIEEASCPWANQNSGGWDDENQICFYYLSLCTDPSNDYAGGPYCAGDSADAGECICEPCAEENHNWIKLSEYKLPADINKYNYVNYYQSVRNIAKSESGFTKDQIAVMKDSLVTYDVGCIEITAEEGSYDRNKLINNTELCGDIWGCQDPTACDFNENATLNCLSAPNGLYLTANECCSYANDQCGVCGGDDSSCSGCTNPNANNYDLVATVDDGSCFVNSIWIGNPTYDLNTMTLCIDYTNDQGISPDDIGFTLCSNGSECMDPQGPEICQFVGELFDQGDGYTYCSSPFVGVPPPPPEQGLVWTAHFVVSIWGEYNETVSNMQCCTGCECWLCNLAITYPNDVTIELTNINKTPGTYYQGTTTVPYKGTIDVFFTNLVEISKFEFTINKDQADIVGLDVGYFYKDLSSGITSILELGPLGSTDGVRPEDEDLCYVYYNSQWLLSNPYIRKNNNIKVGDIVNLFNADIDLDLKGYVVAWNSHIDGGNIGDSVATEALYLVHPSKYQEIIASLATSSSDLSGASYFPESSTNNDEWTNNYPFDGYYINKLVHMCGLGEYSPSAESSAYWEDTMMESIVGYKNIFSNGLNINMQCLHGGCLDIQPGDLNLSSAIVKNNFLTEFNEETNTFSARSISYDLALSGFDMSLFPSEFTFDRSIQPTSSGLLARFPISSDIITGVDICFEGKPTNWSDDLECIFANIDDTYLNSYCSGFCADDSTATGTCGPIMLWNGTLNQIQYTGGFVDYPCTEDADCPDGYGCDESRGYCDDSVDGYCWAYTEGELGSNRACCDCVPGIPCVQCPGQEFSGTITFWGIEYMCGSQNYGEDAYCDGCEPCVLNTDPRSLDLKLDGNNSGYEYAVCDGNNCVSEMGIITCENCCEYSYDCDDYYVPACYEVPLVADWFSAAGVVSGEGVLPTCLWSNQTYCYELYDHLNTTTSVSFTFDSGGFPVGTYTVELAVDNNTEVVDNSSWNEDSQVVYLPTSLVINPGDKIFDINDLDIITELCPCGPAGQYYGINCSTAANMGGTEIDCIYEVGFGKYMYHDAYSAGENAFRYAWGTEWYEIGARKWTNKLLFNTGNYQSADIFNDFSYSTTDFMLYDYQKITNDSMVEFCRQKGFNTGMILEIDEVHCDIVQYYCSDGSICDDNNPTNCSNDNDGLDCTQVGSSLCVAGPYDGNQCNRDLHCFGHFNTVYSWIAGDYSEPGGDCEYNNHHDMSEHVECHTFIDFVCPWGPNKDIPIRDIDGNDFGEAGPWTDCNLNNGEDNQLAILGSVERPGNDVWYSDCYFAALNFQYSTLDGGHPACPGRWQDDPKYFFYVLGDGDAYMSEGGNYINYEQGPHWRHTTSWIGRGGANGVNWNFFFDNTSFHNILLENHLDNSILGIERTYPTLYNPDSENIGEQNRLIMEMLPFSKGKFLCVMGEIKGCMDMEACNLDVNATIPDNTKCRYEDCTGNDSYSCSGSEYAGCGELSEHCVSGDCIEGYCEDESLCQGRCDSGINAGGLCLDDEQCVISFGTCQGGARENQFCINTDHSFYGCPGNCSCEVNWINEVTNYQEHESCGIGGIKMDQCGICGGLGLVENCKEGIHYPIDSNPCDCSCSVSDCMGICNGNAYYDECGRCVAGLTTASPCARDCSGQCCMSGADTWDVATETCITDGLWNGISEYGEGMCIGGGLDNSFDGELDTVNCDETQDGYCGGYSDYGECADTPCKNEDGELDSTIICSSANLCPYGGACYENNGGNPYFTCQSGLRIGHQCWNGRNAVCHDQYLDVDGNCEGGWGEDLLGGLGLTWSEAGIELTSDQCCLSCPPAPGVCVGGPNPGGECYNNGECEECPGAFGRRGTNYDIDKPWDCINHSPQNSEGGKSKKGCAVMDFCSVCGDGNTGRIREQDYDCHGDCTNYFARAGGDPDSSFSFQDTCNDCVSNYCYSDNEEVLDECKSLNDTVWYDSSDDYAENIGLTVGLGEKWTLRLEYGAPDDPGKELLSHYGIEIDSDHVGAIDLSIFDEIEQPDICCDGDYWDDMDEQVECADSGVYITAVGDGELCRSSGTFRGDATCKQSIHLFCQLLGKKIGIPLIKGKALTFISGIAIPTPFAWSSQLTTWDVDHNYRLYDHGLGSWVTTNGLANTYCDESTGTVSLVTGVDCFLLGSKIPPNSELDCAGRCSDEGGYFGACGRVYYDYAHPTECGYDACRQCGGDSDLASCTVSNWDTFTAGDIINDNEYTFDCRCDCIPFGQNLDYLEKYSPDSADACVSGGVWWTDNMGYLGCAITDECGECTSGDSTCDNVENWRSGQSGPCEYNFLKKCVDDDGSYLENITLQWDEGDICCSCNETYYPQTYCEDSDGDGLGNSDGYVNADGSVSNSWEYFCATGTENNPPASTSEYQWIPTGCAAGTCESGDTSNCIDIDDAVFSPTNCWDCEQTPIYNLVPGNCGSLEDPNTDGLICNTLDGNAYLIGSNAGPDDDTCGGESWTSNGSGYWILAAYEDVCGLCVGGNTNARSSIECTDYDVPSENTLGESISEVYGIVCPDIDYDSYTFYIGDLVDGCGICGGNGTSCCGDGHASSIPIEEASLADYVCICDETIYNCPGINCPSSTPAVSTGDCTQTWDSLPDVHECCNRPIDQCGEVYTEEIAGESGGSFFQCGAGSSDGEWCYPDDVVIGGPYVPTTHNISVTDYSFETSNGTSSLEINVGDIVTWTQLSGNGTHNVNSYSEPVAGGDPGCGSACDENTELFQLPKASGEWTFSHTFNSEGDTHYVCDPHAPSMAGDITVLPGDGGGGNGGNGGAPCATMCTIYTSTCNWNDTHNLYNKACTEPLSCVNSTCMTEVCNCAGDILDCAGICGGDSFVDDCGYCVNASTGQDPSCYSSEQITVWLLIKESYPDYEEEYEQEYQNTEGCADYLLDEGTAGLNHIDDCGVCDTSVLNLQYSGSFNGTCEGCQDDNTWNNVEWYSYYGDLKWWAVTTSHRPNIVACNFNESITGIGTCTHPDGCSIEGRNCMYPQDYFSLIDQDPNYQYNWDDYTLQIADCAGECLVEIDCCESPLCNGSAPWGPYRTCNGTAYTDDCDICVSGNTQCTVPENTCPEGVGGEPACSGEQGVCQDNYQDKGCGCTGTGPTWFYYDSDGDGWGSGTGYIYCYEISDTTYRTIYILPPEDDQDCGVDNPCWVPNNFDQEENCYNYGGAPSSNQDDEFAYRIDECGYCHGDGYLLEPGGNPFGNQYDGAILPLVQQPSGCGILTWNQCGYGGCVSCDDGSCNCGPILGHCIDPNHANYGKCQNMDCNGVCFGDSFLDDCSICSGPATGHVANIDMDDCGNCPGDSNYPQLNNIDEFELGICEFIDLEYECTSGSNLGGNCSDLGNDNCPSIGEYTQCSCQHSFGEVGIPKFWDCAGDCGAGAQYDSCGYCTGGLTSFDFDWNLDCSGECGGDAILGSCGECDDVGANTYIDCGNTCDWESPISEALGCEEPHGYNIVSNSCEYYIGNDGNNGYDVCGVCGGNGGDCFVIYGCTNPEACNFQTQEICDIQCDGECISGTSNDCPNIDYSPSSCIYPEENFDCDGNCLVEVDCAGVCGGISVEDVCGECGGSGYEVGACDCEGDTPADICIIDDFNVINWEWISCQCNCLLTLDCNNDCGGTAVVDECGVCGGQGIQNTCIDNNDGVDPFDCVDFVGDGVMAEPIGCTGEWGGILVSELCPLACDVCDPVCDCDGNILDECGVCGGNGPQITCWNGESVCDAADFVNEYCYCDGNTTPIYCDCVGNLVDCTGECGGSAVVDECGVCNGQGTPCQECGSGLILGCNDMCYDDESNEIPSLDCLGVCGGTAIVDDCGVCDGLNVSMDDCGECDGPGVDCNGDCFRYAVIDECGICSGGNTGHQFNSDIDCNGDCFGDAVVDNCEQCAGGDTDFEPNITLDCHGDCDGYAVLDDCGICSHGDTTHEFNSDIDECGVCFGSGIPEPYCDCSLTGIFDCNGECGTGVIDDGCGFCGGNNTLENCYGPGWTLENCPDMDCNGDCGGNAQLLKYYYDGDGDGLGCPDNFVYWCNAHQLSNYVENAGESSITNCTCSTNYRDCSGTCGGNGLCHGGENDGLECTSHNNCPGLCTIPNDSNQARIDTCGICSGGNTGHIANRDIDDCGICFGQNLSMDVCGVCGGNGAPCFDYIRDVDLSDPQEWLGYNIYIPAGKEANENYYYPVLPKYNKLAKFDEENLGLQESDGVDNNPFGSSERNWDDIVDIKAPVTLTTVNSLFTGYSLIDLNISEINDNSLDDNSGNAALGILIGDYQLKFDIKTAEPKKDKPRIKTKIGKKNKGKSY